MKLLQVAYLPVTVIGAHCEGEIVDVEFNGSVGHSDVIFGVLAEDFVDVDLLKELLREAQDIIENYSPGHAVLLNRIDDALREGK